MSVIDCNYNWLYQRKYSNIYYGSFHLIDKNVNHGTTLKWTTSKSKCTVGIPTENDTQSKSVHKSIKWCGKTEPHGMDAEQISIYV